MRADFPAEFLGSRDFAQIAALLARLTREPRADVRHAALGRLFSRWAGVPLGRYLEAVRDLGDVAAAAHALRLNGADRLQSRVVTLVTSDGAGTPILVWGCAPSPFGDCVLAESTSGLCRLDFFDHTAPRIPGRSRDDAWAVETARRVFGRGRHRTALTLELAGTRFEQSVWRALAAADSQEALSYGDLARSVGRAQAARAVGSAVGRNPVGWVVPCHHVVRADGGLGGYRWGAERKRAMLVWESVATAS